MKVLTLAENLRIKRAYYEGAVSSAGRASRLHREGQRFEPVTAHHNFDYNVYFLAYFPQRI